MLWRQMRKKIGIAALSLAAFGGGGAAFAQNRENAPHVELEYIALGEMAARYCEIEKCSLDLPPNAMSYAIIKPYYNSENKTYLEAQLKAYGLQNNYSCGISKVSVFCVPKKVEISIIDSSSSFWNVQKIAREDIEIYRQVIVHNQLQNLKTDTMIAVIDTAVYVPYKSKYLTKIKVLITITEFDLGYRKIKASYISDYYVADYYSSMKYGSTIKELSTSQKAENGTTTSAYTDKLQGLQIQDNALIITANNRDLTTLLFGGSQMVLQVRKECGFNLFGFEMFCGLIQTEIIISLE